MVIPPYKLYKSKSRLGSMLRDSVASANPNSSFQHRVKSWIRIRTHSWTHYGASSKAGKQFRSFSSQRSLINIFCKRAKDIELIPEHRFLGLEL